MKTIHAKRLFTALMISSSLAMADNAPKSFVVELDAQGNAINTFNLSDKGSALKNQKSVQQHHAGKTQKTEFITYSGQAAIDRLGPEIDALAKKQNVTTDYLKEQFLSDQTLKIDEEGNLLVIEESVSAQETAGGNVISAPPSAFKFDGDAFKLHSKPDSTKKIYLNFTGQTVTQSAWNRGGVDIVAEPFNLDGGKGVDTVREKTAIYQIWAAVAEDFLPFDVDITTEAPDSEALLRSSFEDQSYGTTVIITTTGSVGACANCGGIAYIGVFDDINSTRHQPAWVFYNALSNNSKSIAEAISHEAGHNLGLLHDGINGFTYYSGAGQWAPIMGTSYYRPVTQWSNGAYPGANNTQDDIATMISKGLSIRDDDHGNTINQATSLIANTTNRGRVHIKPQHGIIETENDIDVFSFVNQYSGGIQFKANPQVTGETTELGNLDISMKLYDAEGRVLAVSEPEDRTSAEVVMTLPSGTYYLSISASGKKDESHAHGYGKYGSLGQYTITGDYASTEVIVPSSAHISASTVTGEVPLVVSFSGIESARGSANIKSYQWALGNGKKSTSPVPVATYTKPGLYKVSLRVIDDLGVASTTTTTIRAIAPVSRTVSVVGLSAGFSKARRGNVNAIASIVVRDNLNKPIRNAVVRGKFSGTLYSPKSGQVVFDETEVVGVSNKKGVVRIVSPAYLNGGGTVNFTVTDVITTHLVYDPDKNRKTIASMTKR